MLDRCKGMLGIIQNVEIIFEIEVRNNILNINFHLINVSIDLKIIIYYINKLETLVDLKIINISYILFVKKFLSIKIF